MFFLNEASPAVLQDPTGSVALWDVCSFNTGVSSGLSTVCPVAHFNLLCNVFC